MRLVNCSLRRISDSNLAGGMSFLDSKSSPPPQHLLAARPPSAAPQPSLSSLPSTARVSGKEASVAKGNGRFSYFSLDHPLNVEVLVPARRTDRILTVAILPVLLHDSLRAVACRSCARRVDSAVRHSPQGQHFISARISGLGEEAGDRFLDWSTIGARSKRIKTRFTNEGEGSYGLLILRRGSLEVWVEFSGRLRQTGLLRLCRDVRMVGQPDVLASG